MKDPCSRSRLLYAGLACGTALTAWAVGRRLSRGNGQKRLTGRLEAPPLPAPLGSTCLALSSLEEMWHYYDEVEDALKIAGPVKRSGKPIPYHPGPGVPHRRPYPRACPPRGALAGDNEETFQ